MSFRMVLVRCPDCKNYVSYEVKEKGGVTFWM